MTDSSWNALVSLVESEKVDRVTGLVMEAMRALPDNVRRRVIENIKGVYCFGCGCEQQTTGRSCQCENDE